MAVIVFDYDKNSVSVLVEKTDVIHDKKGNETVISSAKNISAGKVFVNGNINLCMIRGERE